jgi:hypothetical protein
MAKREFNRPASLIEKMHMDNGNNNKTQELWTGEGREL